MLPLTSDQLHPVTPERKGAPTYLVGTPNFKGRAKFRSLLGQENLSYPDDKELLPLLRKAIQSSFRGKKAKEMLDTLDGYEASQSKENIEEFSKILVLMESRCSNCAEIIYKRQEYSEMLSHIGALCFLVDIEGNGTVSKKNGLAVLDGIPDEDVRLIGTKAFSLLNPTAEQIKNSDSSST